MSLLKNLLLFKKVVDYKLAIVEKYWRPRKRENDKENRNYLEWERRLKQIAEQNEKEQGFHNFAACVQQQDGDYEPHSTTALVLWC